MAAQTAILPERTDDDKASIFQSLDAMLNSVILYSLLHGIYTGILAVTLWNIFVNKSRLIRRSTVVMIILLYTLTTINFAFSWSYIHLAFIEHGQSFRTVYSRLTGPAQAFFWGNGITSALGTILADLYIIWCCWMVWGRRWLLVLPSMLSLISATVSKIIGEYQMYFNASYEVFLLLYVSFILATTLWCTSLIIYRILTIVGVGRGADGRLRVFQHFIEVLVESSALYSISLIAYLALAIHKDSGMYYLDAIAAIAKGVAPTLLVGRAAAGHTCPKDDWDESAVSTLRFQTPSELCMTSFQESTMQSAVLEMDIEAQTLARASGIC
ncbi:hypothetical protein ARMGADRAFT_1085758 [Armillaria gallica]|uniref:Family A G protein-coupled receptor-like protein n=1 Tax=Armillaria gallica TaxID=47427 RepID=A0A2H3D0U6_ARMGA|nr:hypothetical protein ARMGADRAFT_1085758 [Armillaria gallica]